MDAKVSSNSTHFFVLVGVDMKCIFTADLDFRILKSPPTLTLDYSRFVFPVPKILADSLNLYSGFPLKYFVMPNILL